MSIRDLVKEARKNGIAKANGVTCVVTVSLKTDKELIHFYEGNKRISISKATYKLD